MEVEMKAQDKWPRHWRLILALAEHDEDAYRRTWNEIRDCNDCLRDALEIALRHCAAHLVDKAGGLSKAADLAASEIEGLTMT